MWDDREFTNNELPRVVFNNVQPGSNIYNANQQHQHQQQTGVVNQGFGV